MNKKPAKIAIATAKCPSVYDVTYPGTNDLDTDVNYEYLRRLVRSGYKVKVVKTPYSEEHLVKFAQ